MSWEAGEEVDDEQMITPSASMTKVIRSSCAREPWPHQGSPHLRPTQKQKTCPASSRWSSRRARATSEQCPADRPGDLAGIGG